MSQGEHTAGEPACQAGSCAFDESTARAFLTRLFGLKAEGTLLQVFTLPDACTYQCEGIDDVVKVAREATERRLNVYVAVGLAPKGFKSGGRCSSQQVAGIYAVWCDVDHAHPVHQKTGLPPDQASALQVIDSLGLEPSVVVHSGHGLQAWYRFNEPWLFETDDERREAANLVERFQKTLAARADDKGYVIDSTFDLARVMRLPGTVNWKHKANPVPVTILRTSDVNYNPEDFEAYLIDEAADAQVSGAAVQDWKGLDVEVNPDAKLPSPKFEALLENDGDFANTWFHRRRDLKDTSLSGYDLALATRAAQALWSAQELADLIIAHRRKYKDLEKALRLDYLQRTITTAMGTASRTRLLRELEEPVASEEQSCESKQDNLKKVSILIGAPVARIVLYDSDPPSYRLGTPHGDIYLECVDDILSHRRFKSAIAAATGIVIQGFESKTWDKIAQTLLNACEKDTLGDEATDAGAARAWVCSYLEDNSVANDLEAALKSGCPFVHGGRTHVFGSELRRFLAQKFDIRMTPREMGKKLKAMGASYTHITVNDEGKLTSRSAWMLPNGYP